MFKKKYFKIFFFISFLILLIFVYLSLSQNNINKKKNYSNMIKEDEIILYNSNIIKEVNYVAQDSNGNKYIVDADEGEIDFSNKDIIFLKNINAFIKLSNLEQISILSNFGKYNILNYDTIFNKNVHITYKGIEIYGDYLEFSLENNLMIISRNVTLVNAANILKADVVEMNIQNQDIRIYMYEKNKKVNINSKN